MRSNLLFCLSFIIGLAHLSSLNAQSDFDFNRLERSATRTAAQPSEIQRTAPSGVAKISDQLVNNWDVAYRYLGNPHGSEVPQSEMDSIKHLARLSKLNAPLQIGPAKENASTELRVDPTVALDFKGNGNNGTIPPDNNIAVSDDGYLVSVVNSNLLFADETGNILESSSFADFMSVLNLTGTYFDPKVLYDPVEDKFIMVVLNGNSPGNSSVVIAFSTSSDPTQSWWLYVFNGDPDGIGAWFDYPNIGVSETEFYVTGNLFNGDNISQRSIIYQVEKANGFLGGTIDWLLWSDVEDSNGLRDFTVVPMGDGYGGSIGPGIFFVSTQSSFGSDAMLYWTTETINNNPELRVNRIPIPFYISGGDGRQLGSTDFMMTNDSRTLGGFYGDSTIHFIFHASEVAGFTGIRYNRIDLNTLTATHSSFGVQNFEYAFPNIAPFSSTPNDKSVLIGFLRTGATIYPEFRVVTCDDDFNWSPSVLIKEGNSWVDVQTSTSERWGDYSGISRRHSATENEVWVAGCYGESFDNGFSNILSTWIAKITGENDPQQAPVVDFTANATDLIAGDQATFTDLSTNDPNSWTWSFPGGDPSTSTLENPIVTYHTPGAYDVTLVAANAAGEGTEVKTTYITVEPLIQAPITNFVADRLEIEAGESINFTDLSTNTPTSWVWSFAGAEPATSNIANPTVTYNTPGTYDVGLLASNVAGNDTKVKTAYITVRTPTQAPITDFTADRLEIEVGESINFTDLSTNTPTSWVWSFAGGNPSTSTVSNPMVTYNTPGTYDVSLIAANSAGNDSAVKTAYITVRQAVQAPLTDFMADRVEIEVGESINFTDLSTNTPTTWVWSFAGGNPSIATISNPVVSYNTPGTFDVSLTASNSAGNDSEIKTAYITVRPEIQAPVADFMADRVEIEAGESINFTDLSTNNPMIWSWSFVGGDPSTSMISNPVVTYNIPGTYNVNLTVSNSAGNDSEVKTAYITVLPVIQVPLTDFMADRVEIEAGESITFTDLSTNNPTSWAWSFAGGDPSTSDISNPVVTYNTPGTYDVSLIAANSAGNDAAVKTAYITVQEKAEIPVVNFSADNTIVNEGGVVQFTDQSTNNPTEWVWSFPGGVPNSSSLQNPIIVYPNPGLYDVSLVATNAVGAASATKSDYIQVDGSTSTIHLDSPLSDFILYPNPSDGEGRIKVKFSLRETTVLDFYLIDNAGRQIRHLLRQRSKVGENLMSFNAAMLPNGLYYLQVKTEEAQILKNAKIIIQ